MARSRLCLVRSALACAVAVAPASAGADGWISAELPAAVAVSDAQAGVFSAGAMPAIGAYADNGWFALGARVRAGVLRNGPAPGDGLADPGVGGLATGGVAMRVHKAGGWLEVVGGGGVTGEDLVPSYEVGAGWTFAVGDYDVGPSARWVRVVGTHDMAAFGSADLAVVGVDVRFGVERKRSVRAASVATSVAAPVAAPTTRLTASRRATSSVGDEEPAPVIERDNDVVFERTELSCAEAFDGCPLTEHIQMFTDRIVLDERVLFDLEVARVRSAGRAVIADIAKMWREHPEWTRITVEGHTDVRGSDAFNQQLSERRAANAARVLSGLGFGRSRVGAVGYGRSRPRIADAQREADHHKNRRVEFVIERDVPVVPAPVPGSAIQVLK